MKQFTRVHTDFRHYSNTLIDIRVNGGEVITKYAIYHIYSGISVCWAMNNLFTALALTKKKKGWTVLL